LLVGGYDLETLSLEILLFTFISPAQLRFKVATSNCVSRSPPYLRFKVATTSAFQGRHLKLRFKVATISAFQGRHLICVSRSPPHLRFKVATISALTRIARTRGAKGGASAAGTASLDVPILDPHIIFLDLKH
jgi:hypothetical protein